MGIENCATYPRGANDESLRDLAPLAGEGRIRRTFSLKQVKYVPYSVSASRPNAKNAKNMYPVTGIVHHRKYVQRKVSTGMRNTGKRFTWSQFE